MSLPRLIVVLLLSAVVFVSRMNTSLHDIQSDIQRLASQQNQMHQQHLVQQQSQIMQSFQQAQQYRPIQYTSQQSFNPPQYHGIKSQSQQYLISLSRFFVGATYNPIQSSASAPHIPQQSLYQQTINSHRMEQPQFFLHDQPQMPHHPQQPVPQRRTWAQQSHTTPPPQQPEMRTWGQPQNAAGFVLHDTPERLIFYYLFLKRNT